MVTGSNGFIAKSIVQGLLADDNVERVWAINRNKGKSHQNAENMGETSDRFVEYYCDLGNDAWVESLLKKCSPDVIYHFAATQNSREDSYLNNVRSTYNLAQYSPINSRIIFSSSSTVYGDLSSQKQHKLRYHTFTNYEPLVKQHLINHLTGCNEYDPTIPTNMYGASKIACEAILNANSNLGKIQSVILRYCAVVGPNNTKGLIQSLIGKLQQNSERVELWGEYPGSTKPYLSVEDATSAALHFLTRELAANSAVYNVSPKDELSVDEIVDILVGDNSLQKIWRTDLTPPGDNRLVRMNSERILGTGWTPHFRTSREVITNAKG